MNTNMSTIEGYNRSYTTLADLRKEIECDQCEQPDPSKRCSRCHMTYYCSVRCQKLHWKIHKIQCVPVEENKSQLVIRDNKETIKEETILPLLTTTTNMTPSECSICLSEIIENRIVLPGCGHIFYYACLKERQKHVKNSTNETYGRCPNCRENISESVAEISMEKAVLYAAAGRLMEKVHESHLNLNQNDIYIKNKPLMMDERQEKLCQLALEQINQVLDISSDPQFHVVALLTKGQILCHAKPLDAIVILEEVLRMDAEGTKVNEHLEQVLKELDEFRDEMYIKLTVGEVNNVNHPMRAEYERRAKVFDVLVAESSSKRVQVNYGPFRLYPVKTMLAEAYENAYEYKKAEAIYNEMLEEVFQLDPDVSSQIDPSEIRRMFSGESRCLFMMKDYFRALELAEMAVDTNRYYPGVHILLAQAQWVLWDHQGAIRTMCRGVLYEQPWDEVNKERNRKYLNEFVSAMKGKS